MGKFISRLLGFVSSLSTRHEKFIFTTLARILAVGCMLVAAFFAWKLGVQLSM